MAVAILAPDYTQAANVRIQAVVYGIESDVLRAEPGDIQIELSGDSLKIQRIAEICDVPIISEKRGRKLLPRDL
jgi:hypothetical protein